MKKSTKIVSMVIAVTLVMAIMTFVIYAATAGKVGINASVSWTAQAGVDLEFWGRVSGGDTTKEIAKTYINPTTTNATAKIVDDLSCNFSDNTDDGVNNPNAIVFRYYVRNKSLTPLKIQVTKYPTQAEESGTSEADHTPKVELGSQVGEENTLVSAIGAGYELKAGDTFEYSVTLSMASGGTGTINADTGLTPNFDAGVTFNFTVGGNSNGTIITSVDGATPTSVSSSSLVGKTLGEYLATQQTAEYSTGWFFDEGLTKVVSDDYLSQDLKDSSLSSFYNRTASITGLVFTLSSDGNSYLVSGESSTSPSGEVVIPNMYAGKIIKEIKENGFQGNTNITSVALSKSISKISNSAFDGCKSITNVSLSNNITYMGWWAFQNNSGLTNLIIPESITEIGFSTFNGCSGLTGTLVIPNNITKIGGRAFQHCSSLTGLVLSDNLISIGGVAFSGCNGLSGTLIIPKSVKEIEDGAFTTDNITSIIIEKGNMVYDSRNNCNAIIKTASNTLFKACKNSTIPSSITSIGSWAFSGIKKLATDLELPQNLISIGDYAFNGCSKLTGSLNFPNSLTSIGASAFRDCSSLTGRLIIPEGITSIGSYTFYNCSGFTGELVLPNSLTSIGTDAFEGCKGLTGDLVIPSGVAIIENWAFRLCSGLSGNLILSEGVTTIKVWAFAGCSGIKKVYIPSSVTTIEGADGGWIYAPFRGCSSIIGIYCGALSKPDGWGEYWNFDYEGKTKDVTWGVTRAQFDAL